MPLWKLQRAGGIDSVARRVCHLIPNLEIPRRASNFGLKATVREYWLKLLQKCRTVQYITKHESLLAFLRLWKALETDLQFPPSCQPSNAEANSWSFACYEFCGTAL